MSAAEGVHAHVWWVPVAVLRDEPARRAFLSIIRRAAPTGRIVFRRREPVLVDGKPVIEGMMTAHSIEVYGCTTVHGE